MNRNHLNAIIRRRRVPDIAKLVQGAGRVLFHFLVNPGVWAGVALWLWWVS